jgi:2-dehydropantoate 2-reductase
MLADVRANRDTEIDFINGYIIKMGHKAGVEVIENEAVVRRIKGFAYYP